MKKKSKKGKMAKNREAVARAAEKKAAKPKPPKTEPTTALARRGVELPSKQEARAFTDALKNDAVGFEVDARKKWISLGRRALEGLQSRVHEALGQKATAWMQSTFGKSWQSYRRAMKSCAVLLPVISLDKLELITEGNAYALLWLPKELQTDPKWIEKAIEEENDAFAEDVYQERKKRGLVYEKEVPLWEIFLHVRKLPETTKETAIRAIRGTAAQMREEGDEIDINTPHGEAAVLERILADKASETQHLLESIDVEATATNT